MNFYSTLNIFNFYLLSFLFLDKENEALKKELIEKEIELKEMSETIAHAIEYSKKETHAMQWYIYFKFNLI